MFGDFDALWFLEEQDREKIKEFIEAIEERYGDLTTVGYEYDVLSELHCIWHTNAELEYNNQEFNCFIGNLLANKFMDNGIYNICFGYNYELDYDSDLFDFKGEISEEEWDDFFEKLENYNPNKEE